MIGHMHLLFAPVHHDRSKNNDMKIHLVVDAMIVVRPPWQSFISVTDPFWTLYYMHRGYDVASGDHSLGPASPFSLLSAAQSCEPPEPFTLEVIGDIYRVLDRGTFH